MPSRKHKKKPRTDADGETATSLLPPVKPELRKTRSASGSRESTPAHTVVPALRRGRTAKATTHDDPVLSPVGEEAGFPNDAALANSLGVDCRDEEVQDPNSEQQLPEPLPGISKAFS